MIASVVATIEDPDRSRQQIIEEISMLPCVEVGDLSENPQRIAITIDSPAPNALEDTTQRIQQCAGVSFVDVVFVHFEDTTESPTAHDR